MKRVLSVILTLALILALSVPAFAETAKGSTLRLASFSGTVSMTNASGNAVTPKADLRLYNGYTISTGSGSEAYISLDGTKAVKLGGNGKITVKQSGRLLEVGVLAGTLYFNVTAPLKGDENLNIRTSTMVTGVRGSFGWVNPMQAAMLHGHANLICMNPDTGASRITELFSGQLVYFGPGIEVPADPELKKIDFIRELVTNEDVPAMVVAELRDAPELQALIEADVPSIDVPELLGLEEEKRIAEEEAEAEQQAELEVARAAQDAELNGSGDNDFLFDETGDSGSGTPSSPTFYTVTLPRETDAPNLHNNYNCHYEVGSGDYTGTAIQDVPDEDNRVYSVAAGSTFRITVTPLVDASSTYVLGPGFGMDVNGAVANYGNLQSGTLTFTVNSDLDLTEEEVGGVYLVVPSDIESDLEWPIAVNSEIHVTGDVTFSVDVFVTEGGTLTVDSGVTATLASGTTLNNNGTVTVLGTFNNYSSTTFNNNDTLVINDSGARFVNGDGGSLGGRLVNSGSVTVSNGQLVNNSNGTVQNGESGGSESLISIATNGGSLWNYGSVINSADCAITNDGYIHNNGSITNQGTFVTGSMYNGSWDTDHLGAGTLVNSGSVDIPSGKTLSNHGDGTITNNGDFDNSGTLENMGSVSGSSITGSGTVETSESINTECSTMEISYSTVHFVLNGGTLSGRTGTVSFTTTDSGTTVNQLPTPTHASQAFQGWCTDEALTNVLTGSGSVSYTYETYFYAKWE